MHTALLALIATLVLACCQAPEASQAITGIVTAGPVCPLVTEPPDPACDDRPMAGAEIVVRDASGETVARVRTAEDGTFSLSLASGRTSWFRSPSKG